VSSSNKARMPPVQKSNFLAKPVRNAKTLRHKFNYHNYTLLAKMEAQSSHLSDM